MNQCLKRAALAPVLAAALALGGCGFNLVNLGPPPSLYDIRPEPSIEQYPVRLPWQLIVEEPIAIAALDTDRILVRPSPYEVKYYAGVRWTDRAPLIVQKGLVEAFEETEALGVGRQEIGLRGDYNLKSELRALDSVIEPGESVPTVRIRLNIKIIRQPTSLIVASRTFEARKQAKSGSIMSVVDAFEDALTEVLESSVNWTLTEANADYLSRPPSRRTLAPRQPRSGAIRGGADESLVQELQSDVGLPRAPPGLTRPLPAVGP